MTKKCKSCREDIDAKAKKCPKCQADQRNWFARHPILTALLILIVIGIIGSAAGGNKSNSTTSQSGSDTQKQAQKAPEMVTATQIADDFDANQVSAEKKWSGKYVQFTATVSNITDSGVSFYNVATKVGSLSQISCAVSDKDQLVSLKNGSPATVKGTIGSQTIGVISLSDCSVVK